MYTRKMIIPALLIGLVLLGCSTSGDDFVTDNTVQETLKKGTPSTLDLFSGASITFPGNAYEDDNTVVTFSNLLSSTDSYPEHFPTPQPELNDLICGVVINTPVSRELLVDLVVTFAMRDDYRDNVLYGPLPDQVFAVYRYDFDNLLWNRWGSTTARFDTGGILATATLPTNKFRGFIGSVALFHEHTAAALPAVALTTISGTLRDTEGIGIATDIGVYNLVGTVRYPAAVVGGAIPSLPDPQNPSEPMSVANMIQSQPDGTFIITLPDNLIGQRVALHFGEADATFGIQDEFDVLAPGDDTGESEWVNELIVRYGVNNIAPQGVPRL